MKSLAAFLTGIVLLAGLALPVSALESSVLTVCDKNLSIDIGPSYEIVSSNVDASSSGMISNDFFINDTAQTGSAVVSILTIFDEILTKMNPDALSELFLIGGVEAAKENGDTEIGKWMAADSRGRNVSVTTMSSGDEDVQMPNGVYNISIWNLDSTTYALLVSSLDVDNTTQIIKTLAVS